MNEIMIVAGIWATSLWAIIGLGLFLSWLAHVDSEGWSIFWMLVFGILLYNAVSIPVEYWIGGAASYLPIGVLWSQFRWTKWCVKRVDAFNELTLKATGRTLKHEKEALINRLAPKENITRLANWIVVWPFSMIDSVLGDLWEGVIYLVKNTLIKYYNKTTSTAIANIADIEEVNDR